MFYLISCAGFPNYGDELIARSWLSYLAEHHPGHEVWLDCPTPGNASLLFEGVNPAARFTDTLWRLAREHSSLQADAPVQEHIRRKVEHLGSPHYDAGLLKLWDAESLHLLGGGYLNTLWPAHYNLVHALNAVKALNGARLYGTGLGLMPQPDNSWLRQLFSNFTHVSVRDTASAAALGIATGLDDAFLGAEAELMRGAPENSADLIICLQSDLSEPARFAQGLEIARREIQVARSERRSIRYIEALPGSDWAAYDQLRDLLRDDEFIPFLSVWRNGFNFSAHQRWITSRFHYHFMAAAAGALGIVIEPQHGYYDIKHGSLIDLGSGWHIGADVSAVPEQQPQQFSAQLKARAAQKTTEAETLYPAAMPNPSGILPAPPRKRLFSLNRR